jgi:hypothetical protein
LIRCPTFAKASLVANALLVLASIAPAQSFNCDSELTGHGVPTALFGAAANQSGFWNDVPGTGPPPNYPLRNLSGALTSVTVSASGGTGSAGAINNPINTGDYAALLNDGQWVVAPTTYTIQGLVNGPYRVFSYFVSAAGDIRVGFVTVPGSTSPNPQTVTGPMPGNSFQHLITHAIHDVVVTSSTLAIQLESLSPQNGSMFNGFQLVMVPEPVTAIGLGFGALALLCRKPRRT